jgi:hypothetical protein
MYVQSNFDALSDAFIMICPLNLYCFNFSVPHTFKVVYCLYTFNVSSRTTDTLRCQRCVN